MRDKGHKDKYIIYDMKISQVLPKFYDWLKFKRNVSEKTIDYYKKILGLFLKEMGDMKIKNIKKETIWDWQKRLIEKNKSQRTQRFYIVFFRVFLKFCKEENLTNLDITQISIPPKPPKRNVEYLSNGEVNKFTNSIKNLKYKVTTELLLSSGMRISELLSLNRDSIKNNEAKIIGKGNKERVVYFSPCSLIWLEKYLKRRKDINPALILGQRGERMTPFSVESFFRNHCKKIGMEKRVTPHTLRRTFGTNLLMNGANLFFVQNLLGHSDIKTTAESYLGVDLVKLKQVHKKYLNYDNL